MLTNKYSEGYPGKRYYGGNAVIDEVEALAIERAKSLFGAEHANVQPHSGANANMCAYQAMLEPGDTVLGSQPRPRRPPHPWLARQRQRLLYHFVSYKVTPSDERIDMDQVRDLALEHRPRMIVAGANGVPAAASTPSRSGRSPTRSARCSSSTPPTWPASSPAALQPDPVPYADIVTFTTHKTLRGPRGGCILSTAEHAAAIDKAVFPGWQGGPLEHVIAGKAVAFREAAHPSFKEYAHQIVTNASALAEALAGEGFRLRLGRYGQPLDGRRPAAVRRRPDRQAGPEDARRGRHHAEQEHRAGRPRAARSSRAGCASARRRVTTQGMEEPQMATIAQFIARALRDRDTPESLAAIRAEVAALCAEFPAYP